MDDKTIIIGLEKRDQNALREIEHKYKTLMSYVALQILGIKEDTEECVNDSLLDIWNSIPPQKPESIKSFSLMIVRRRAIDRLEYNRAKKRFSQQTPLDEIADLVPDNSDLTDTALADLINDFLGKIPQDDRRIFVQRYYLCLPIGEICKGMNLKQGTVFSKLSRTKEKLRLHLAENGVIV